MLLTRVFDPVFSFLHRRDNAPLITLSSSASCIPAEIILAVLELAYYDEDMQPDVQLLADCAVVCRAWSAPAQSLIFRHVSLRSGSAVSSFCSAVDRSTSRGRALGDLVVRLHVTLDHNHPDQPSHHAFAHAVCLCPNLYELDIALYGCAQDLAGSRDTACGLRAVSSLDSITIGLLREGPRIRSLKLSNWSIDSGRLAFQLLAGVWPSLTAVSLRGTPPCFPASEEKALKPSICNLIQVEFNFQRDPGLDFVSWLLSSSCHSLRCLEFGREPSPEFLGAVLRQYGPSLESLSIPSCTSPQQIIAVQNCERLKEIRLESASVFPILLKQLPSTVEHLAFAINKDTLLYLLVNFVKAQPNLKALTVHFWDGGNEHPQLPNLKIACAYKGVELLFTRSIQCFRATVVSIN
ncbi:hypothetical protein EW145_g6891 [Phellinidium pouzarii]|uniref:F-box domain-containing protein n=1 Tax=Phellinidium pouzarii TaxID=167371 RepID=A0A4S4KSE9_9AGAM|nr:hypothetical protein EW145_g6891 [Phellinidium pouzarii]